MSASSSFSDLSLHPPHLSSNSSFSPLFKCFSSRTGIFISSALSVTYILFLPLLILVVFLGFRQWRKQRSASTAAASHSDVFTYHSIAMQLNEFLGFTFIFCGSYLHLTDMFLIGYNVWSVTFLGVALFHVLTCLERYLAVVHPITYLGLRQAGGVRIRNISIGCVWFLSFGWLTALYLSDNKFSLILHFWFMVLFLILISFCSISVLCALKRPGPGEVGGNRERVDQSKQRAFNTIMAILGVLLLKCGGNLLCNVMYSLSVVTDMCLLHLLAFWSALPSRLVLPLLFLLRAGKLQCCKRNTESG